MAIFELATLRIALWRCCSVPLARLRKVNSRRGTRNALNCSYLRRFYCWDRVIAFRRRAVATFSHVRLCTLPSSYACISAAPMGDRKPINSSHNSVFIIQNLLYCRTVERVLTMKNIQWFPGHMTKAMRDMEAKRDLCDGVICVLDARAPIATLNKNLKKIFGEKPILYVLNKADLADGKADAFVKFFEDRGKYVVKCDSTNVSTKRILVQRLNAITQEKRERAQAKGLNRTFRFMVAGIPNTGKSTIVNLLSGQKRAKTGDKAGVTRDVRWLKCGEFDLLDTPGTMPPSFENQYLARHLAYIGSINDDILDMDDVALELLGELAERYPECLTERYGITDFSEKLGMYEAVCKRRGFIFRGGEFDYERGAKAIVDDFRKGRTGKICLEDPKDYKDFEF